MKNSHRITRSLFIGLTATIALLAAVLAPQRAGATIYYWDNNSDTAGFGTAGGIWDTPTPGPVPGWSTDGTGASVPGSVTTATTDDLNFGNGATGLGAGTITLNGTLNAGTLHFASGSGAIVLTNGAALTLADTATITVDNGSDTIATPLAGAGTGLTKAGTGTLILSGDNAVSGTVTVTGGELQLNNGLFNLGAKALNVTATTSTDQQAVFNLANGSLTNSTSDAIGGGNNAVGVFKMSGGNYIKTAGNLNFSSGAGKTNYSAFLMSGGYTYVGGEFDMARDTVGASTYVNLSGGTFQCNSYATVGREGFGVLDISGGTLLRLATAANKFYMNRSAGSFSDLTIRGTGTLDIEDSIGLRFANSSGNAGSGVANLMTGGTIISRVGVSWNGAGITYGYFNFNGGTLQASGSSPTFWTDPWSACYIYSGGAIIDSQANDITISQPFSVPTGNGITSITGGTGSGYLAPPVVSISGDGTGATAIAQIDDNGTITNILVSNPGVNYTTATVTLIGGGGTSSGWTANISANATSGGLTKLGSGTLILTGASTYQGPTVVSEGTLAVAAFDYPPTSALILSNSAALSPDVTGGYSTLATPNLTLYDNTMINLSYGDVAGYNPVSPAISDSGVNPGTILTAGGTNIVINLSGSGFVPGQFPLIKYSGSIGGNGFAAFKLGTLPNGVPAGAKLINNTANSSIDLSIPAIDTLTWNGDVSADWDTDTANWKDSESSSLTYKEYGTTNIYGDIVIFDDSLGDPAQTNINLTMALRPSAVNISSYSIPYTFSGSGKLSGSSFLNVNGGVSLTITTTNDYDGGSTLSGGTVLVGNDAALGIGIITLAGSILSSDSATPRTLNNPVSITADTTFGTDPSSGKLTLSGPVDFGGVGRGLTLNNDVSFTGPASNGGIIKSGAGTLVMDNASTLLTGDNTVSEGTLVLSNGDYAGGLNVADFLYETAVAEIENANITNSVVNNVGTGASGVGVLKQSGGNYVMSTTLALGSSPSCSAAYLMSGGYARVGDFRLDNLGAVGLFSQSGGLMESTTYFSIARDGGLGVYDLSGGTHYRAADTANRFYLTRTSGSTAQVTIRGSGTLDIEDNDGLSFANNYANDNVYGYVNLLTGGTLISRVGIYWGSTGAGTVGYVNFNGGTLRASGSSSDYWSGWTGGYIYPAGAVIDSQDNDIVIGQALLAPTGSGVSSITGFSGSGYLSPPVVTISGDGTGATAIAQIDSSGNLTGILVTCSGVNYTSASVGLSGGGGTGSGGTANLAANATTGGLTKLGSGTLTLAGANTYGGATTVSGGTLVLSEAHAGQGNVTVADGATLGCWSDASGASIQLPSATIGATAGAGLLAQFTGNISNPTTPAGYITNLTLNGTTPVSVLCSVKQVGSIPLFQYSTLSGAGSITTGTLPQGLVGTVTNDTSTKTISLVVSSVNSLVWSGADSSTWDIGVTTNWTLSGTPATYQDGAAVLFNDASLNGNVTITEPVSPQSIVFSNNTVAFSVGTSGAGVLGGVTGLTKNGSGTVTLAGANSYTGLTVIKNGTLQIGDGTTSGTLADGTEINVQADGTLGFNNPDTFNAIANNISGTGTINKDGAQMGWVGSNTFSGTINIVGGKLAFSGADSEDGQPSINIGSAAVVTIGPGFVGGTATFGNLTGAGNIDCAFGGTTGTRTMQVNQTTDGIFSGPMHDSGARLLALIKTGPATLTLSGTNSYTGGTIVSNGTLIIDGDMTGNSTLTVNSGTAFGGNGTVAGSVSFSAGSTATNTVGTPLTVDTLDMAGDATMKVATTAPLSAGDYPLIKFTTLTSSGQFTNLLVGGLGLASGATASVGISNNVVNLNVVGGTAASPNIGYTVTGSQLVLDWPAGQGWQLQMQATNLNVGLTTNWVTVTNAVPPYTNAIDPTAPAVFYRLKN